jgi:hypothetical protein
MVWRLYDTINGQWYDDTLYETRTACTASAEYYMREAHAMGEVLELIAEPFEASELLESLTETEEEI